MRQRFKEVRDRRQDERTRRGRRLCAGSEQVTGSSAPSSAVPRHGPRRSARTISSVALFRLHVQSAGVFDVLGIDDMLDGSEPVDFDLFFQFFLLFFFFFSEKIIWCFEDDVLKTTVWISLIR